MAGKDVAQAWIEYCERQDIIVTNNWGPLRKAFYAGWDAK